MPGQGESLQPATETLFDRVDKNLPASGDQLLAAFSGTRPDDRMRQSHLHRIPMKTLFLLAIALSGAFPAFHIVAAEVDWKAGVATLKITPEIRCRWPD